MVARRCIPKRAGTTANYQTADNNGLDYITGLDIGMEMFHSTHVTLANYILHCTTLTLKDGS